MNDAERAEVLRNTEVIVAKYKGNSKDLNAANVLALQETYRANAVLKDNYGFTVARDSDRRARNRTPWAPTGAEIPPAVQRLPPLFNDYNGIEVHEPYKTHKTPPQNCLQRGSLMC